MDYLASFWPSLSATNSNVPKLPALSTANDPARIVLAIPELFDSIMIHLDQRTLLTKILLVSREWNTLTTCSSALQKHLFFEPDDKQSPRLLNPILTALFPDWFPTVEEQERRERNASFDVPSLSKWLPRFWTGKMKAMSYEYASWRLMLPSQPPPYRMVRCLCFSGRWSNNQLVAFTKHGQIDPEYPGSYQDSELPSGQHEYSQEEISPEQPIQMHQLYSLVLCCDLGGRANTHMWHAVWDLKDDNELSRYVGKSSASGDLEKTLKEALKRDGLVFFEWSRQRCGMGWPHPFLGTQLFCTQPDYDSLDPYYFTEGGRYGHRVRCWPMGSWSCKTDGQVSQGQRLLRGPVL